MFAVKNIMETNASLVYPETHVFVALTMMLREGRSGFPVIDKHRMLVGFLSEKDLLGMLLNHDAKEDEHVKDYMTVDVKTFGPEDSAVDVCEYFMEHSIHVIPIVEQGEFLGIVRRCDIIYLILKIRGKIKKR